MTDDLRSLMSYDPLSAAEKLTGTSYKEDEGTVALGMLMAFSHNAAKQEALTSAGDTHYSSSLEEQLAVFSDLGFEEVLKDEFVGDSFSGAKILETFHILWHPEGVLATVESYEGTRRNNAKIYYNLLFHGEPDYSVMSSGSVRNGVLIGDHDAREGLRTNFNALKGVGEFLPVWVEAPFLWLLTYMDHKSEGYSYTAINKERISRLPEHVREAIKNGDRG